MKIRTQDRTMLIPSDNYIIEAVRVDETTLKYDTTLNSVIFGEKPLMDKGSPKVKEYLDSRIKKLYSFNPYVITAKKNAGMDEAPVILATYARLKDFEATFNQLCQAENSLLNVFELPKDESDVANSIYLHSREKDMIKDADEYDPGISYLDDDGKIIELNSN